MAAVPTTIASAARELDRDAADEGVGRGLARSLFLLPFVGAVLLAATVFDQGLFLAVVHEDGPLEWSQFALFATSGVLFAVAAWRAARRGDVLGAVLLAVGALGILGIAGEEISWGQRILGLETPEALATANHQDEINIHNITSFPVQKIGNYLQLVLGGLGMAVPWLTRLRRPRLHVRVLRLLSPPLFLTACFGLLFAYRAVRLFWDSQRMTAVKFGEWPEFTFALGLAVFAALLVRDLARDPSPAADGAGRAATVADRASRGS